MAGGGALVTRLSHGLALLQRTSPRRISTPHPRAPPAHAANPRAPPVRRASVAILLRVRPSADDEQSLAEQYGADGQPLPGTAAAHMMQQLHRLPPAPSHAAAQPAHALPRASSDAAAASAHAGSYIGAAAPHVLRTFFDLPWVRRGTPEVFYIKRATRAGDNWSAQVAFPGGRREEGDENGVYTALRETWEETGIDLMENSSFVCLGQLDDREITSNLGNKLLMILSPYVFLQTSPFSPPPNLAASEVASCHWIPLTRLESPPTDAWGTVTVNVAHRLAPRSPLVRCLLRALVGDMDYRSLYLPNQPVAEATETDTDADSSESKSYATSSENRDGVSSEDGLVPSKANDSPDYPVEALSHPHITPAGRVPQQPIQKDRPPLQLWGLTLGMTLDFLSCIPSSVSDTTTSSSSKAASHNHASHSRSWISNAIRVHMPRASWRQAPSFSAAFPRFTYPDVNMWIWIFGFDYRRLVADWAEQIAQSDKEAHQAFDALHSQKPGAVPVRPRPGGQPRRGGHRVGPAERAMSAYFAAVRRALMVTIVLRGIGALIVAGTGTALLLRRWARYCQGLPGWGLDE